MKKIKFKNNLKIDKIQSQLGLYIMASSFLLIFGLFASRVLLKQYTYQNRVITQQKKSLSDIATDQSTANNEIAAYENFVNTNNNILGGLTNGSASNSGNNAKIILDALPQAYDFPALLTSLQALISIPGITINSINGTDTGSSSSTTAASPTQIPFTLDVSGSYDAIQDLLNTLQDSIRPIQITTISFNGTDSDLDVTIAAQTYYYNPPTGLILSSELIQ